MKKSILFILVLAITLSFCTKENNPVVDTQQGVLYLKKSNSDKKSSKRSSSGVPVGCLDDGVVKSLYNQTQLNAFTANLIGKAIITSQIVEKFDSLSNPFYILEFIVNDNGIHKNGAVVLDLDVDIIEVPPMPCVIICSPNSADPCGADCQVSMPVPCELMSCQCTGFGKCDIRVEIMNSIPAGLLDWVEINEPSTCEEGYVL
jgi:hypothetical protein